MTHKYVCTWVIATLNLEVGPKQALSSLRARDLQRECERAGSLADTYKLLIGLQASKGVGGLGANPKPCNGSLTAIQDAGLSFDGTTC